MTERMWLTEQIEKARTERDQAMLDRDAYAEQADKLAARVAELEAALTTLADEARGLKEWKETVRDIYDDCHFNEPTAMKIVAMIEDRHPGYFNDPHVLGEAT